VLKSALDRLYASFDHPESALDPVQIVRRYPRVADREIVGFIAADDPRFVSTVEAIRRELSVDGLLLRYRTEGDTDGLPPGEGVFLACTFWLVEVLAMQGKGEEARALFERLLGLGNDVGLFSEEYDPTTGRMLGNFPQALTHLALVEAALALGETRSMRGVERVTGDG